MTTSPARLLYRHGNVLAPTVPAATALVVVGEVLAWVGSDAEAQGYVDDVDRVVDLEGRLVTPGFVDAHVHLAPTGEALQTLDLSSTSSLGQALDVLRAYARGPGAGIIRAQRWDEMSWPEARPPTRSEVDRAVGGRPACLTRVDGHSAVVSSGMVTLEPTLPAREGWGPDGRVDRAALTAVRAAMHDRSSRPDRKASIALALSRAAQQGITSVHELNAPHISRFDDFTLLDEITRETPGVDVARYWGALGGVGATGEAGLLGFAGDLNMDGAVGSRTACLHEPYCDHAGDEPAAGHLFLSAGQVADHVVLCTGRGIQAGFHVIGDRALHECLDGFERAAGRLGPRAVRAGRHRLEHVEMPSPDDIAVLARLGIVASVQPAFDALWGGDGQLYETRLGAARAVTMNPFASFRRAGVVLALGSDSPVTPMSPWGAVQAAAEHHNADERLPALAAFEAHTRGGHRARRDDASGVLAPGLPATFAQWDVAEFPRLDVGSDLPRCLRTVVAGRTVHSAVSPAEEVR